MQAEQESVRRGPRCASRLGSSERTTDVGRCIAEVHELPGVLACGTTSTEVPARVQAGARASRALAALLRIGWVVKRRSGSQRTLSRGGVAPRDLRVS